MSTDTLTEEQLEFLATCEEEFKDRYTDNDEEYLKVKNNKLNPPIMYPWNNRSRRYDSSPHHGSQRRNWRPRDHYYQGGRGGYNRYDRQYRDRDRDRGRDRYHSYDYHRNRY